MSSYIWQYCIGEIPGNETDWINAQVTSQASVELTSLTPPPPRLQRGVNGLAFVTQIKGLSLKI